MPNRGGTNESSPLLAVPNSRSDDEAGTEETIVIRFEEEDEEDSKQWSVRKKAFQILNIFLMAITGALASSVFTPGSDKIAEDLGTSKNAVVGATTGYVVMLGVGPLLLAPLSETFGRRQLYLWCFTLFSLSNIPIALCQDVKAFIVLRTLSGFFGSVAVANGGGTISDMFPQAKRATPLGIYLLGPLLGPTLGPVFGGLVVGNLGWRFVFYLLAIIGIFIDAITFFFLSETYAPVILEHRKQAKQKEDGGHYRVDGEDSRPMLQRLLSASRRPLQILFLQPIVLTLSIYQALVFSTMYSLYAEFIDIFGSIYGFDTVSIGLMYLGPTIGFLIAVAVVIPFIDKIYSGLAEKNSNEGKPEYRLPIANVGAVLLPISLFWFAWCTEYQVHWLATISSTLLFGASQVAIFNAVQNYYLDSFEKYAASSIAAGAFLRSIIGGVVPLFVGPLFEKLGYGWGFSVFGFISVVLMPAPLVFFFYGEKVRERFAIDL